MARSNQNRFSIIAEVTPGLTPNNPQLLVFETNGDVSVTPNTPSQQSNIARLDGRLKDNVAMNQSADVGFSADLAYPTLNQALYVAIKECLHAAEVAQAVNSTTAGITVGGTTITRGAGSWVSDGFTVGDIAKTSNASNPLDNRYVLVTVVTALVLTVQIPDAGVWAGTDADVTVTRAARMKDSTTGIVETSYSGEDSQVDIGKMNVLKGLVFNSMDVGFGMGQKASIAFGLMGRNATFEDMTNSLANPPLGIAGATYVAPTQNPIFPPIATIMVVVDGKTYPVEGLRMTTTRNVTVGHDTKAGKIPGRVSPHTLVIGLSGQAYWDVTTLLGLATTAGKVSMWFVMEDAAGKALSFSFGKCLVKTSKRAGGMNNFNTLAFSIEVSNDDARDAQLTLQRWE